MSSKLIWVGVLVGSSLGGYLPSLFGSGLFSLWGVLGSTLGGFLGVWAGVKLSERYGF